MFDLCTCFRIVPTVNMTFSRSQNPHKYGGRQTWNRNIWSCACYVVAFAILVLMFWSPRVNIPYFCGQVVCPNILKCQISAVIEKYVDNGQMWEWVEGQMMSTTSLCIKVTTYVVSCTKRGLLQTSVPLIYLVMTTPLNTSTKSTWFISSNDGWINGWECVEGCKHKAQLDESGECFRCAKATLHVQFRGLRHICFESSLPFHSLQGKRVLTHTKTTMN